MYFHVAGQNFEETFLPLYVQVGVCVPWLQSRGIDREWGCGQASSLA